MFCAVTSDKNYVNRLFKIQNMADNLFLNDPCQKITYFAFAFLYHVEKVVFFLLQNFLNPTISLFRKKIFMLRWNDPGKFFKICHILFIPQDECPNYVEISSWKICRVISSNTKLVFLKSDIWWLLIKEKHLFKRILKFFVLESYSIYSNSYIPR